VYNYILFTVQFTIQQTVSVHFDMFVATEWSTDSGTAAAALLRVVLFHNF